MNHRTNPPNIHIQHVLSAQHSLLYRGFTVTIKFILPKNWSILSIGQTLKIQLMLNDLFGVNLEPHNNFLAHSESLFTIAHTLYIYNRLLPIYYYFYVYVFANYLYFIYICM